MTEESRKEDMDGHKLMFINVNHTFDQKGAYDAVRYAWKLDVDKAEEADYVLAEQHGLVVGVFIAYKWMEATKENFPNEEGEPDRYGFEGEEASDDIKELFLGKRLPKDKGDASPIHYSWD